MATTSRRTKGKSVKSQAAYAAPLQAALDRHIMIYKSGEWRNANDSAKASSVSSDPINHPAHYNTGKFEVIDVIEDWKLGFHLGNVVKYIARSAHKGSELADLKKAAWYLSRHIAKLEPPKPFNPR